MGDRSRFRPPPSPALAEMTAKDREEAPFGGFAGELATPAAEPQVPALPPRLVIPPPPWAGGEPDPEPEEGAP